MYIESIQLYNSLHPQASESNFNAYRRYLKSIFEELQSQNKNLFQLNEANQNLPPWIRERQSIVWIKIDFHPQDHLELVQHSIISNPNEMLAYLSQKLELNLLTERCQFAASTTELLLRHLVDHLVWIKTMDDPLVIWHLETNYLTITTTSIEQVRQCAVN